MKVDDLVKLRPTDNTVPAIEASLAEIDKAERATKDAAELLAKQRPGLLLSASAADIRKLEAEISEFNISLEQLAALREAVQPELAAAKHRAKLADARAAGEAAADLVSQAGAFFSGEYRALVAEIIEGLELEKRAVAAATRYRNMVRFLGLGPDDIASLPVVAEPYRSAMGDRRLFSSVNLPPALPFDTSDETPLAFYRGRRDDSSAGVSGTTSAAADHRQRHPNFEGPRAMTPAEIAEAERRGLKNPANRFGEYRQPGGRSAPLDPLTPEGHRAALEATSR